MGFFERLREKLIKTRQDLSFRISNLFSAKPVIDDDFFSELEEILITSDMSIKVVDKLLSEARKAVKRGELKTEEDLRNFMKVKISQMLAPFKGTIEINTKPFVIMVVGVNGVGKTTTIAKMAKRFIDDNKKVVIAAADTFRAAAIEQLQILGRRVGSEVVAHQRGADPSAVVFDSVKMALAKGFDILIVDTAGRLHTKINLMEELKKVRRVLGKDINGSPHEIILVLDATTGQNALQQARSFHDALAITGIIVAKLDGTAKGGILLTIADELKIPIKYIGVGEGLDDLRDFDPVEFAEAILD